MFFHNPPKVTLPPKAYRHIHQVDELLAVGPLLKRYAYGFAPRISSTEKPAAVAACTNRRSPQIKLLREGRFWHQVKEAASCRASAARKK